MCPIQNVNNKLIRIQLAFMHIFFLSTLRGLRVQNSLKKKSIFFPDKHKLAAVMFNYFDHNYNGRVEKVELWKMQLRENMDEISTLCTLLDLVTFDELGVRDEELSPDEFIQAFGKHTLRGCNGDLAYHKLPFSYLKHTYMSA